MYFSSSDQFLEQPTTELVQTRTKSYSAYAYPINDNQLSVKLGRHPRIGQFIYFLFFIILLLLFIYFIFLDFGIFIFTMNLEVSMQ